MRLDTITIRSNIKDYSVYFENNADFLERIASRENTIFVVDSNVWEAHQETTLAKIPQDKLILLPVSEDLKNINTVCELYEKIMSFAPRKNLTLVSIGGGITQDLTGFVASSLYRGINWIFIPTTLLAQVDSCIGAKTSLNFKHYKNLVGTFYPPSEIYIYPEFLKTLTREDFYSGVGEMAKLHLMSGEDDAKIFIESLDKIDKQDAETLLARTQNCLKIKKSYIEDDEFDTGKRNMLNYGHCFGHAIESSTDFAISHGQAVVVGMILANKEAVKLGLLSQTLEEFIYKNVLKPILVVEVPKINIEKTIDAMRQDKKNLGKGLALVMLTDSYKMQKITNMTIEEAGEILLQCQRLSYQTI